jgi:DNA-binding MarR family transcriptional regulator
MLSSIDIVKYNIIVDKLNINSNLSWLLLKVSFRSKRSLIELAEEYDLTLPQLYVLASMEVDKSLQMNKIAALLACDPSNVTGIIDRMFAQKYIERQENPHDRRAKLVSLTPQGAELQAEITKRIAENNPSLFNKLDETEKAQLNNLLEKLLQPIG